MNEQKHELNKFHLFAQQDQRTSSSYINIWSQSDIEHNTHWNSR